MSDGLPAVVWLHGVGGPPRGPGWQLLLNRELERQGFPRVPPSEVVVVDYRRTLLTPQRLPVGLPQPVPVAASAAERRAYEARRARLAGVLEPWRADLRLGPGMLPPSLRQRLADRVSRLPLHGFPEVRLYLDRRRRRRAVIASVIEQLPPGPFVLIAHSLGSVVAVDLLAHLAPGRLRLLLTVGSPLALEGLSDRQLGALEPFPYDRVEGWVNLRTRWDWITGGAPLDARLPAVIDLPIDTAEAWRGHHQRRTYLTHPATAAAVGRARVG